MKARVSTAVLSAAVRATRLYMGSNGKVRIRDAEKLYARMTRAIEKVAKDAGMEVFDASEQIAAKAKELGPITPLVGRDI